MWKYNSHLVQFDVHISRLQPQKLSSKLSAKAREVQKSHIPFLPSLFCNVMTEGTRYNSGYSFKNGPVTGSSSSACGAMEMDRHFASTLP